MRKRRILDLFCGAGGASWGYHLAGFEVVGVDLYPQPSYPFEFVQADALDYFDANWWLFDAWHASPPCQAHTMLKNIHQDEAYKERHIDLIEPVRGFFEDMCSVDWKPWVIENVVGAPLNSPLTLCGNMFGLKVYRHRIFETNCLIMIPPHRRHVHKSSYGYKPKGDEFYCVSGHFADFNGAKRAMDIDWVKQPKELAQSIPPAYTEWIGKQLIHYCEREKCQND